MKIKKCLDCNKVFNYQVKKTTLRCRICSDKNKSLTHKGTCWKGHIHKICKCCGKEYEVYQYLVKSIFCSIECRFNFTGGVKHSRGYIRIKSPKHPYKDKDGYVAEHRLVCEKILNRYLLPNEVVHHINSNSSDNRIENLYVFNSCNEHSKYHKNQYSKPNPPLISNL